MNSFGEIYRLISFGESHGIALGGVVDGMPAGVKIDVEELQEMVDRRRPGLSATASGRRESDCVEILSGIFEGITLGTPIGFIVRNNDQRSSDYENLRHIYRPNHGDYTWHKKYGIRDYRGGGRASARETVSRVVAGALTMQALRDLDIYVEAEVAQIGEIIVDSPEKMEEGRKAILEAKSDHDSLGGVVSCRIIGCPAGLGDPVFGKLQARLASAMMSIPAAKGFEYGMGFRAASARGSRVVDEFIADIKGGIHSFTNYSGGIQGGISNGNEICFRVAFKPVATLSRELHTANDKGENVTFTACGRHDPCVVERAVPVVESMAAMVVFDSWLLNRLSKING